MPERACRHGVASGNERRPQWIRKAAEAGAKLAQGFGVRQRYILRKADGPGHEFGVERIDLTISVSRNRLLVGCRFAEGHITGWPIVGNLTRIDLIRQV